MKKALGIDLGDARIGVAASDDLGMLAHPLETIPATKGDPIARILELAASRGVAAIVIGMPRNMDGTYGPSAQKVRDFISQIQKNILLPITPIDERLTTAQASKQLAGIGLSQKQLRKKVDSSSACLILQQYLDRSTPLI